MVPGLVLVLGLRPKPEILNARGASFPANS
jgi:hypothetical protein